MPVNGTSTPSLVTVKARVGSRSSKTVPYLRTLTSSVPVLVTSATSVRSSMEFTEVVGVDNLTARPPDRLKGVASAALARARRERRSIARKSMRQ